MLQFLEEHRKDIAVLHNYPTVKKRFLKYNSVFRSSAPVERLFSFAGIITRPHRCKMSDKTFEKRLLLKEIGEHYAEYYVYFMCFFVLYTVCVCANNEVNSVK